MNENKKKIAFIINPISGTQSKEQILKWLDEKLDKERYAQEVIYTERAGHAVEIAAQKAQEDAHAVIAIGGDGTINEIARSLVHTKTALHHSLRFRQRTCPPSADSDGAEKGHRHHQ